jgi:hypothetical protein
MVRGSIFAGEANQCRLPSRNTDGGRHVIPLTAVKPVITVYAFATPNSVRVPIALEELALDYELRSVNRPL